MTTVYKIMEREAWAATERSGIYEGSALDRADGFIHLSAHDQVEETARRHFAGRSGLVLASVDLDQVSQAVRWEPSRGGDLFPHLYGPLPVAAVTAVRALDVDAEGAMRFADGTAPWA